MDPFLATQPVPPIYLQLFAESVTPMQAAETVETAIPEYKSPR